MNRVIIPENPPAASPAPLAAVPAAAATAPLQNDPRDALAGSLPAWDLLPATPFFRRVK